jgi:hypothetical protein
VRRVLHAENAHRDAGLRDVTDDVAHLDFEEQAVVRRGHHEPSFAKRLRLLIDVVLRAGVPSAAVDPEDDGQVARAVGGVDVEDLARVGRSVREVAGDVEALGGRRGNGGGEGGDERDESSYGRAS